jgi:sugar lactone lactonase YvrE
MLRKGTFIMVFLGLVFVIATVGAVTPAIWKGNTQSDFSQGEPANISVTSEGEVVLAPNFQQVTDTEELYIWCIAEDRKGNLYTGTGNSGKIFRIDRKGEKTLFFDSPEVGIHSLAVDRKGNLYAGSSPDGIIYKITPEGMASTFSNTGQKYVWSLALDDKGYIYAGTGEKARILKISPRGKVKELYASTDNHIMCLVCTPTGSVFAGTEGSGIVYKVDPKGRVMALYDAPEKEIHSLVLTPEADLYVGAMSGTDSDTQLETPNQFQPQGSTLYRITTSGAVWPVWHCPEPLLLSLLRDQQGNLIVGTGEKGIIYSVTPEGKWTVLLKCQQSQPLSLCKNRKGEIFVGTEGKLYRLMPDYAKQGDLTSQERDMTISSRWGKVSWRAETPEGSEISLQTRSGNTEQADSTWSQWSEKLQDPTGSQITSFPGRFLQYRVNLSTSNQSVTPVLKEISIASLQNNLKPEIKVVNISSHIIPPEGGPPMPEAGPQQGDLPPGRGPQQPPPGKPQRGLWRISWIAQDPNNDSLVYDLYFRGSEEKNWKLLEEGLRRISYVWNTTSCPDGTQLVKVVASDRPSNSPHLALSTEKVSRPFVVDNTPPQVGRFEIEQLPDGRITVTGKLKDATSPLKKAEYSIDSGEWLVIFPTDEIFDSKKERFYLTTEALTPGEHTIVVRVTDFQDNIGTGKAVVEVLYADSSSESKSR